MARFSARQLRTRTGRQGLQSRSRPYFEVIYPGLRLGYRRNKRFGKWVARCHFGIEDDTWQQYQETFAVADDKYDPDGQAVLDYWQACEKAREIYEHQKTVLDATGRFGTDPGEAEVTVDDAVEAYIRWFETARQRKNQVKAMQGLRGTFERYVLPHFSGRTVSSLRTLEIVEWHKWVAENPQGGTPWAELDDEGRRKRKDTANRVLKTFRAMLNRGRKLGLITCGASAWDAVESFQGVARRRERFLTPNEATALLGACATPLRQVVQLAMWTGFRISELLGLKVGDFVPEYQGQLKVVLAKTGHSHIQPTGSLYPEAGELLRSLATNRNPEEALLTMPDGQPWSYSACSNQFRQACQRAGLDDQVVFHTLRHSAVSWLVQAGVSYPVIANYIGHRNTRMIERHYGHLSPGFVRDSLKGANLPTL